LKEAGIDVEADAWMGMIAPAHTPEALVAKIQREVVEAIGTAAIRDKLAAQLMEPIGNTPAEFRARIDGEIVRWAPVIKAADIKVN
jgi:tripartite-type tricarboxylate transporter receptor subunit TctC